MESVDERALIQRANAANREGDWRGAIAILEGVLDASPSNADARRGLAHVMFASADRERAIEELRRAIADGPGRAMWEVELARMLTESGRMGEALEALRRAEALEPRDASFPGRIAMLGPHLRAPEIGIAAAERAIALDPNEPAALLAMTKEAIRGGRLDEAESLAMRVVGGVREPMARAMAMHQVARVREKRGQWAKAFDAHRDANVVKMGTDQARHSLQAPGLPFMDYLGDGDGAARYASWRESRPDDGIPAPVVLTGFPRSGTTMTEQVLGAHPSLATCEERPLCIAVRNELDAIIGRDGRRLLESLDDLTEAQVRALRATYRAELLRHVAPDQRSRLLVDKHPMRILDLGLMNRLFPECRVVFMVRDPRDVCLSAFFQDFAITPELAPCLSLPTCAGWYARVMGFWLRLRERVTMPVLEVRYEDLVSDFDAWAGRILEFIGVGWDDRVREFYAPASERMVRSASFEAVTEPLNSRSIGRWKNCREQLAPVLDELEPFVEAFGYEPSAASA